MAGHGPRWCVDPGANYRKAVLGTTTCVTSASDDWLLKLKQACSLIIDAALEEHEHAFNIRRTVFGEESCIPAGVWASTLAELCKPRAIFKGALDAFRKFLDITDVVFGKCPQKHKT